MREIGGEFWDVPVTEKKNHLFPASVQWFLSGRSALRAIVRELKRCSTVAMPSWCCDSMLDPFEKEGMKVFFYPVCPTKTGLVQEIRMDCDVLFLMDYFGYTARPVDLKNYKGIIVRDVTHSILSEAYSDADYYFGSLRKWCGVWTGGYAWTKNRYSLRIDAVNTQPYISLREEAMKRKEAYIRQCDYGMEPEEPGKDYLKVYEAAEEHLEDCPVAYAAERDNLLAIRLDVETIRARRRENARTLMDAFEEQLVFPALGERDCPMFVPILVPRRKRDALRQFLIGQRIYCPVHWPVEQQSGDRVGSLYADELSLVCDQRYTKADMNRIVEKIREFWREQRRVHSLYTG